MKKQSGPKGTRKAGSPKGEPEAEAPEAPAGAAQTAAVPAAAAPSWAPALDPPEGVERPDGHVKVGRPTAADEGGADASEERLALLKELPFLSNLYNETYLYLVPCDPAASTSSGRWGRRAAERPGGALRVRTSSSTNYLILRVYDVTDVDFDGFNASSFFEVDDFLNDKVGLLGSACEPGRHYVAELGYRAAGTHVLREGRAVERGLRPARHGETAERYVDVGLRGACRRERRRDAGGHRRVAVQPVPLLEAADAPRARGEGVLGAGPPPAPALRAPPRVRRLARGAVVLRGGRFRLHAAPPHDVAAPERDKVDFRLTVSLTPPLLSMMQDPLLKTRAARHIDECIALAHARKRTARAGSRGTPRRSTRS